jgi:hypothetical protein
VTVALFVLLACPPGHPPGPRGDSCEDISDCNESACGELVPCVRGFCLTEEPKVVVQCPDAGPDGSLYECDFWYECNDEKCGDELVACIGGYCDPNAPRLSVPCEPECSTDSDCAVALPYDPTCGPCPRAMSRADLALEPCLYAADAVPPGPVPDECHENCTLEECALAPRAAECMGTTCVGVEGIPCDPTFVPGEPHSPPEVAGSADYVGRFLTVFGVAGPGPETCNETAGFGCDPGPRCVAPLLLDGLVELRGFICGAPVRCSDEACAPTLVCRPLEAGASYDVSGTWFRDEVTGGYYLDVSSYQMR